MLKNFQIIDRTIPEIVKINKGVSETGLLEFCDVLKNLGVDYIELDKASVEIMKKLDGDSPFIFRVNESMDLNLIDEYKFHVILIADVQLLKSLKARSEKIILEIHLNNIDELGNWFLKAKDIDFTKLHCLRIKGLSKNVLWDEVYDFSILRETYGVKFDICIEDEFYCATGITLGAIERKADFVTTTFCGKGGVAALEEVIMALKILYKMKLNVEPYTFSLGKTLYEGLTKEKISGDKPVLGQDIFKYESGIHVDGLIKNSRLYEPYEPKMVGLKRQIILGKHSGTAAIVAKIIELKLETKDFNIIEILADLRKKSIEIKGPISDEEFINICFRNPWEQVI